MDFELSIQNSIDWLDSNTDRIDTLAGNCYWPNPYFSSAWLKAWWKREEGLKKPVLLIVENEKGELLGFWPFVERTGILKSKGLWPFIFDEANYFYPIAERVAIPYLLDGLQRFLKKNTFAWIPLMIKKFREEFV